MNILNRQIIFNGPIVDIEQMDVKIGACGSHTFQIIRHPGGAGVLPVHADGTVSLIRQLRPAVGARLLEIPAGRLDNGEAPLHCARRELEEETGMTAATFIPLGIIYSSPGVFDEVIHLFAAHGISQGEARPEADEEIEVVRLLLDDALLMSLDGRISDAKTLSALHRFQLLRRFGKDHA